MAKPPRFLFDTDFSQPQPSKAEKEAEIAADPLLYTQADFDAAQARARAEGEAAGLAAARAEIAAHTARLLETASKQLTAFQSKVDGMRGDAEKKAAALAYAIARKLANAAIAQAPYAETVRLIEETLVDLNQFMRPPRLTIWVAEPHVTPVTEKTTEAAARTGFTGEIRVLADAKLKLADCRLEWGDGGVERSHDEVAALIDEAVRRYLETADAIDPLRDPARAIGRAADAGADQPPPPPTA